MRLWLTQQCGAALSMCSSMVQWDGAVVRSGWCSCMRHMVGSLGAAQLAEVASQPYVLFSHC
jgi:hypothetical protein